ncbi:hypothetical protein HYH02_009104 [Chlamydomonas schloesseri]|uniref:Uncharacterized protein n=1 Tax=Chlamydomonas schloesseri TaxID=2026947 RepID=A0A835WBB2_9CHLO|nr:hypothetical protein HYH02_009104 [Chlamydomonas schloesseri]|eukprot:KAG2444165.1 hypothetical protein HYH02_009104 [Chlamydomonas schloesseri]
MHSALGSLQQQAQRRLLVEACLSDVDELQSRNENPAEPDSGAAGAPAAGSEPCPSRDRARASLRRLHPTAWLCAEPAASSVVEPGVLKPASRLLQAATAAAGDSRSGGGGLALCWGGKRLPWAHLAARERAAAEQVSGTGIEKSNSDDEKVAQGWLTQQPRAPQDWSWLASPPWGVAPLPPELAARVDAGGRLLLPGGSSAAAAVAAAASAHAVAIAASNRPHSHPDPRCAELYRRLHRMTGAAQQVLAVAAAAADAAPAAVTGTSVRSAGEGPHLQPTWARNSRLPDGAPAVLAKIAASIAALTQAGAGILGGGLDKPPTRYPGDLETSHNPQEKVVWMLYNFATSAHDTDSHNRRALCECLQPVLGTVGQPQTRTPPAPPPPCGSDWDSQGQGSWMDMISHYDELPEHRQQSEHRVMEAWHGGPWDAQALLALVAEAPQEQLEDIAMSGVSPWRGLVNHVLAWCQGDRRQLWRWLLETAAAGEEAEVAAKVAKGRGTTAAAAGQDASRQLCRTWGDAATEVLRGAACWLAIFSMLHNDLLGGPGDDRDRLEVVIREAFERDPLCMAVAFPMFLLARALHPGRHVSPLEMYDVLLLGQLPDFPDLHWPTDGPGAANRSPAARRRDGPPPPPLSYAHALEVMGSCLWEPQATHAMFRALWCRGQNDMRMAVGELLRSWFEAWAYAAEAGMEAKARCKRGMLLAHEAWVRGVTALSDDDVRNVLVRLQLSELAANGGGWLGAELETVLDCLLGGGGSRGGGGGWAGAGAGAARLVSDVQVAEARAGLAAFAQDRGLTDVLAALPAYRPPAAALAAALRALLLLRIVPGAVPPVAAYLSPEEARRARAGVEAAAALDTAAAVQGGGCDLVRVRVPAGDEASTAALLLVLSMHTVALERKVADACSYLLFQPAFRAAAAGQQQQRQQQQQQRGGRVRAVEMACGGAREVDLDVCRVFKPAWPQSDAAALSSPWRYPWLAVRQLAVAQWTDKTTVSDMVAFLRLNLLERHLGICAAGVQGVVALGRMLVAVAKLREELRPSGGNAAAAAGRDVAAQINRVLEFGDDERPPTAAFGGGGGAGGGNSGSSNGSNIPAAKGTGDSSPAPAGAGLAPPTLNEFYSILESSAKVGVQPLPPAAQRRHELSAPCAPPGPPAGSNGGNCNGNGHGSPQQRDLRSQAMQQSVSVLEVPPDAGGDYHVQPGYGQLLVEQNGRAENAILRRAKLANLELAAAAVLRRLQLEGEEEGDGTQRGRRGKEARRKLPRCHLKLDVWFFEVAPGRPWELVLPAAERVADWNKRMAVRVLATQR